MNYGGAYHDQQWTGIALPFLWPVQLGLIWICMILLANPIGDFPLNDDWAYAYSVSIFFNMVNFGFPTGRLPISWDRQFGAHFFVCLLAFPLRPCDCRLQSSALSAS